jgi:hypothetical protein
MVPRTAVFNAAIPLVFHSNAIICGKPDIDQNSFLQPFTRIVAPYQQSMKTFS